MDFSFCDKPTVWILESERDLPPPSEFKVSLLFEFLLFDGITLDKFTLPHTIMHRNNNPFGKRQSFSGSHSFIIPCVEKAIPLLASVLYSYE